MICIQFILYVFFNWFKLLFERNFYSFYYGGAPDFFFFISSVSISHFLLRKSIDFCNAFRIYLWNINCITYAHAKWYHDNDGKCFDWTHFKYLSKWRKFVARGKLSARDQWNVHNLFFCSIFLIGSQYSYHIYAAEHYETKNPYPYSYKVYACAVDQQPFNGFIDENLTTKRNCCMRANARVFEFA